MDNTTITHTIMAIVSALVALKPLVKELASWHLALKKLQAKVPSNTVRLSRSKATEGSIFLGRWFMVLQLVGYVVGLGYLLWLACPWAAARAASAQDVALIGLLVVILLQNSMGRNRG